MSVVDQVLSNDVFDFIVQPLQQKLVTRLTKRTVFAPMGRHDQALSDDLCVLVCVLLRYTLSKTTPIAELSKRTVQSACYRSGDTQSGRACGCSFGIRNSYIRGCHCSCSIEIRLRIQRNITKASQTRPQERSSSPVKKSEALSD